MPAVISKAWITFEKVNSLVPVSGFFHRATGGPLANRIYLSPVASHERSAPASDTKMTSYAVY